MNILDVFEEKEEPSKSSVAKQELWGPPKEQEYRDLLQLALQAEQSEDWMRKRLVHYGAVITTTPKFKIEWDWFHFEKVEAELFKMRPDRKPVNALQIEYMTVCEYAAAHGVPRTTIEKWLKDLHPQGGLSLEALNVVRVRVETEARARAAEKPVEAVAEVKEVSRSEEGHYVDVDGVVITDDDGNPITDDQIETLLGLSLHKQLPQTVDEFEINGEAPAGAWASAINWVWQDCRNILDAAMIQLRLRMRWLNSLNYRFEKQAKDFGKQELMRLNAGKKQQKKKLVFKEFGVALFFRKKSGGMACANRDEIKEWLLENVSPEDYDDWKIKPSISFDVREVIKVAEQKNIKLPGTKVIVEDEYATMTVGPAGERSGWTVNKLKTALDQVTEALGYDGDE